ncbi:DUF723 domain-containing protein [Iodobacter fluviatilis]|uniref:Protein of uncharacterized function (DUF723) n=1 Tax=Iodobacter fluviatilis TaxID=537 RepID=A0A377Q2B5_9NEIS|nr:DUF723 domain-containing protein [Iodobacter fluviatilis]TCU90379.1 uncharacterized protein DUF723 [Iodobacter fluviatilis]STQ89406.1 Protein of uncharacterised function (DUF723) [Iodobacter fluviatilis]
MALNLSTIQARFDKKFPSSGIVLSDFTRTDAPITLTCPIHGKIQASKASNILASKHPCPQCGNAKSDKAGIAHIKGANRGVLTEEGIKGLQALLDTAPGAACTMTGKTYKNDAGMYVYEFACVLHGLQSRTKGETARGCPVCGQERKLATFKRQGQAVKTMYENLRNAAIKYPYSLVGSVRAK